MTPPEIAIVGIGCRFPGGASNCAAFWDLLAEGRDAIIPVPEYRWDTRRFLASEIPCPSGKTFLKEGGFLENDIRDFDHEFFSISPRETEALDPQQRLLLEVSYEALEDAGYRVELLRRKPVGVFIGAFTLDNMGFRTRKESRSCIESTDAMGFSMTLLANRLSHAYDWIGPSMAIDTACSSSLVAIHEACRSLETGECEMAVAGGVNFILGPDSSTAMSRGGFLSPRCRSRAFDRSADGYARGEGAGVVLLKPLGKAEEDGDRIHAVIRGTGVNQDGRTAGIALPNPESQKALIQEVYTNAGVSPGEVSFVEAHGTGTSAGDRIELSSIRSVFSPTPTAPLFVSSVKTNIGHLEAAAGVAGLIKSILCLQQKRLPPHLHLEDPVSELDSETGLFCPTEMTDIPKKEGLLIAGVNSFGYGGTNAHVILQEAPSNGSRNKAESTSSNCSFRIMARLSARSKEALQEMAGEHERWLEAKPDGFDDWKYTLMNHRSRHRFALTFPADQPAIAGEALRVFASSGQPDSGSMCGRVVEKPSPAVFVCTGMGPQWWGMGRDLFDTDPDFTAAFENCDKIFRELSGWSIRDELLADEEHSRMEEPQVAQPANFCLQVALAALWKGWGITPSAIIGHSVGEVGSAYLSGALTLEEAMTVSFHRSRLQHTLRGTGGMLAVGMGEGEILERIEGLDGVSLAAVNSPLAVTLAGDIESLELLAKELDQDEIFQRMLPIDVPYHSATMDLIRDEFRASLDSLHPSPTKVPLYSTVTGDLLNGEHCKAGYWWSNLRLPVRFDPAVRKLLSSGHRLFLELGPHPVLGRSIREIADAEGCEIQTLASLRNGKSGSFQIQRTRGSLDLLGHELPSPKNGRRITLPAYSWQRRQLWRTTERARQDSRGRPGSHVFLQESGQASVASWETEWNALFFPYVEDHVVGGEVVWPGAAYIEAGLALNLERNNGKPASLEGVRFHRLLRWEKDRLQRLSVRIDSTSGHWTVACSRDDESFEWTDFCSGNLIAMPLAKKPQNREISFENLADDGYEFLDVESFYSRLRSMRLDYRGPFRGVRRIARRGASILVEIAPLGLSVPSEDCYQIHPALLDAVFQSFAAVAFDQPTPDTWIPTELRRFHFFRPAGTAVTAEVKISAVEEGRLIGAATIWDSEGRAVASLEDVIFRKIPRMPGEENQLRYHPDWEEAPLAEEAEVSKLGGTTLLVLPPQSMLGDLQDELIRRMTGDVTVFRWKDGAESNELSQSIRHSLEKCETEILDQVVFVAASASASDEVGEESLWNLVELIRSELWLEDREKNPVLTVITSQVFRFEGTHSDLTISGSTAWGAGSVIANESPFIPLRLIDLPAGSDEETLAALAEELRSSISRHEIMLRGGSRWIRYWKPESAKPSIPEVEVVEVPTESDTRLTLQGRQGAGVVGVHHVRTARRDPGDFEIEILVEISGLNFKDFLKVIGQIPQQALEGTFFGDSLGIECSGLVVRIGKGVKSHRVGDRVAAFSREGCFGSHIMTSEDLAFPLPEGVSFEDGACLVPWLTAWHALKVSSRLQSGESVLIHAAAGGVGLAALQVAKASGAIVFATASSDSKRSYLAEQGADYVLDSSSLEFAGEIRRITDGRGVDVILNSLAGDALMVSFDLLAPYGRFVEIGKRDIIENRGLPMDVFNRNISFISIDLDRMLLERPNEVYRSLEDCFKSLGTDRFTPLPYETFPASEAEQAFRLLGDRTRIGRVNLRYAGETAAVAIQDRKTQIRSDAAYLVTGGTGGLGLSIAQWLVEKGARQLVLLSRNGLSNESARKWKSAVEEEGVEILAPPTDISDQSSMEAVFEEIHTRNWQLAGVFHCALELVDKRLKEVTREMIRNVFAGKVHGARVLEHLLETEPELDLWVAFSSVSTLLGNQGQGVYVAANTWLEQFAERRQQLGKPAMTLLLGYLGDTGVASRSPEIVRYLEKAGLREMDSMRVAEALPELFDLSRPVQGFFDIDWESWDRLTPAISSWHRFSRLISAKAAEEMEARFRELQAEVEAMEPKERAHYIENRIAGLLSEILSIPADRIDSSTPVSQLGIDSLMAMAFLLSAREKLGMKFSESDFANDPTIADLRREVLSRLQSEKGERSIEE